MKRISRLIGRYGHKFFSKYFTANELYCISSNLLEKMHKLIVRFFYIGEDLKDKDTKHIRYKTDQLVQFVKAGDSF